MPQDLNREERSVPNDSENSDRQEFDRMFASYWTRCEDLFRAFIRSRFGAHDLGVDHDEVMQVVAREMIQELRPGMTISDFRALGYRITRNKGIDELRKKRRRPVPATSLEKAGIEGSEHRTFQAVSEPRDSMTPSRRMALSETREKLRQALRQFKGRDFEILTLRYLHDRRTPEIADEFGIDEKTVRTACQRAMVQIRRFMGSASQNPLS